MEQLIAIGNRIINLDRVTVIEIETVPAGLVARIYADSSQPVIEIRLPAPAKAALLRLVSEERKFPG